MKGVTVPAGPVESCRYDYTVNLAEDGNQAKVVRLVGTGKRVLELGCATGYMSQAFRDRGCQVVAIDVDAGAAERAREFCERVIVGDLDEMDLEAELGEDHFDVVVAADVLEHLVDPPSLTSALKSFLKPGGRLVACVPNVAHGSVRLALLGGEFPYGERGLLDRTHLRFYTRRTLVALFENTGYAIRRLERHEKPIEATEVKFDSEAVPPGLVEALAQDPDALAYQFIVVAEPRREGNPP